MKLLSVVVLAQTYLAVAQTCSGSYSGTPGDSGWLKFINCGKKTSPSSNTQWANQCSSSSGGNNWPTAGPYSFPADLDTGYGPQMSSDQIYAILSLVWLAENGGDSFSGVVPWWRAYSYIQNIGDGRGYTTNIVGFCTGTGDDVLFLKNLQSLEPCNPLTQYIPDIQALSDSESDALTGLDGYALKVLNQGGGSTGDGPINPNYIEATWNTLSDQSSDGGYWGMAMKASRNYNLALPISKGQLYDIALNNGNVNDIIKKVSVRPPTASESGGSQEIAWLAALQKVWIDVISDKSNQLDGGQNDRGVMWQHLLNPSSTTKNSNGQLGATNTVPLLQLELPMTVNIYGSTVTIKSGGGTKPTTTPVVRPTPASTTSPAVTPKPSTTSPSQNPTPVVTQKPTPAPTTSKPKTIPDWITCRQGVDKCASNGWVCCVAPADVSSGKMTCRPGGDECAYSIPDWYSCNPATDTCASSDWVCCVAPADVSTGKTTCRPGGDECAN
ncbi:hypothetical protein AeNC1_013382 [Aphanomyces euteiches]|nr:hypothetical protein AeNC1_013382 [Aphanomyces euteiches]